MQGGYGTGGTSDCFHSGYEITKPEMTALVPARRMKGSPSRAPLPARARGAEPEGPASFLWWSVGAARYVPWRVTPGGMERLPSMRKRPAGASTRPPPARPASSRRRWKTAVASAAPLPSAPVSATLHRVGAAGGSTPAAASRSRQAIAPIRMHVQRNGALTFGPSLFSTRRRRHDARGQDRRSGRTGAREPAVGGAVDPGYDLPPWSRGTRRRSPSSR